ncbi:MAG: [acyl-carrier-protein] S-malonyltransferase [Gammaproteobacteria bacterium]|nr:MAG: [acyl-carrier-protein] S-malonyltransferase [Gammaproteobacteria bacterium]
MSNKTAFVFPGQGSQSVGMLADFSESDIEVQQTFEEASESLGYDLWQKVKEGPAEELNKTEITQPAILTAGVAVWKIWQKKSEERPQVMAGHSLGEYTALVCGGAIAFADAVKLVETRGRLMQKAVPAGQGLMAAVLGLDDEKVKEICSQAAEGQVVSAVNFNAPGQVVIAGNKEAVERACSRLKENGARRAQPLAVSVPSHCSLMKGAAEELKQTLNSIKIDLPQIPVIHNYNVEVSTSADAIVDSLVKQLYCPVRWVETVQKIADDGAERMVECGPGKVLVGLNKRIVKGVPTLPVFDNASLEKACVN